MFYIIDKFQLIDSGWPRCSLFEPQERKQPLRDLLPDTVKERRANEAVPRYRLFLGFHWSVDGSVIRARPPRERDNSDPSPRKYVVSLLKIHRTIYIYFKIGENWRYKGMSLIWLKMIWKCNLKFINFETNIEISLEIKGILWLLSKSVNIYLIQTENKIIFDRIVKIN